ncbi:MAG: IS66 family transposase [Polyangiaceae bacterium]|nr:IS66 family transposase [Polyangiaceae bacterium]
MVDIDAKQVQEALDRISSKIDKEDFDLLNKVLVTLLLVTKLLRAKQASVARLRRFLGIQSSEKTQGLLEGRRDEEAASSATEPAFAEASPTQEASAAEPSKKKQKGHGRIAAEQYENAVRMPTPHPSLAVGVRCPCCPGKLYGLDSSSVLRVFGQPNLIAKCWELEKLRCASCGHVYTAPAPAEAQGPKFDESAKSTIAYLRFGAGMPHHRLARMQQDQQTPVPASTQWELIDDAAQAFWPILQTLKAKAAQGTVIHNDDTYARILQYMGKTRANLLKRGELEDPERTGLFTTAVLTKVSEGHICLFYTGRKHAGENLANLLVQRASDLQAPVLMSDALSRNLPKTHQVYEANCLSHGRRNFVDEFDNHPEDCTHVLTELRKVFVIDKECEGLTKAERLRRHKAESAPVMQALCKWMKARLSSKSVEPNSGLGKAFNYMLKRWKKFTLFTRKPGVPIHNNLAERALKRSILHRRGSLFFRTQHGADVGDLYTSIIHTAELNGENPWEYLTVIQRNAAAVRLNPSQWLPWNYKQTAASAR